MREREREVREKKCQFLSVLRSICVTVGMFEGTGPLACLSPFSVM